MDKNLVRTKFEIFQKISFPASSDHAEIDELRVDIIEYDGFIAGLIMSFLDGDLTAKEKIEYDPSYEERLIQMKTTVPALQDEVNVYLEYLNKLKDIISDIQST